MYVDDVLDSCETVQGAITLRQQTSELVSGAGFNLRKWMSNQADVIKDVPVEDRLPGLELSDGSLPTLKTLGVLWNARQDIFKFVVHPPSLTEGPTKREVLSSIAKLFDPLQFLASFTIRAKLLLQKTLAAGIGWEDKMPENLCNEWNNWVNELSDLNGFEVPRPLRLPGPTDVWLHTFSDASQDAYAAVSYLVSNYEDHEATSRIVASKSRVTPLKSVTIPRLELMGAVLATRLANSILQTLTVNEATYWTDSTNVLYWVRNQSRAFKPFVANRVAEIQRHSNPEQWRHIPGGINPADLPTRGLSATNLCEDKLWMKRPEFLTDEEKPLPEKLSNHGPCSGTIKQEEKKVQVYTTDKEASDDSRLDPKRYSSMTRLIRVTAWVKRFIKNCKSPINSRDTSIVLQNVEIKTAELFWIRKAQAESFVNKQKDKRLLKFCPIVDKEGILRVDGRLRLAEDLPYDTRHPIILPKDHPISRLVILAAHEKIGHGTGTEYLLTELRSRFWIIKGRLTVRTLIGKCPGCRRRFLTKPCGQKMAPLPTSRITLPLRAFERIGTDFAGPFLTKQGRGKPRMKRYLCLFTCLTTRAVHLEMAYSLDTDSFINAFVRLCARRGTPSYVISDNGTNFVAGEKEIREKVKSFDQQKIMNKTTRHQLIEWKFNPPSSPHFGGVFESMVKSAKKAMRAILGDADITDEELHTAICGAEGLLNSRPITYVSSTPDDLEPLTPSHFLVGQLGGQFAPDVTPEQAFNPKKRWRRLQQLIAQIWKRWRKEFLPSLNVRGKWFEPKRELKPGDVVLVVDQNAKRYEWPLGRIQEIYRGGDGLIRVVKIRVGDNEYIRPVHRLCPLERDNGNESDKQ
ncbi:uncharacterized protein LOC114537879 [Dendronephthya gigantea]|uniref:uncharacterized protein LOC114537879 n=1 Tax=Dendronephthya gigantea TaxID=151771 RepID=UPI00106C1A4D|nr:uncharacterized protein LOC114537879 [Dendronephthya gigantea]